MSYALAAVATAVSGPAAAAALARAKITDFSIALYDLDPFDAIAPQLTFVGEQLSKSEGGVHSNSVSAFDGEFAYGNFQPTSAKAMLAFGRAQASTDTSGATATGDVSGYGSPSDTYAGFYAIGWGVFSGFALSPWTGVTLTATFDGTASTTTGDGESAWSGGSLLLYIFLSGENAEFEDHASTLEVSASCIWRNGCVAGETNSVSGSFSLDYENRSANSVEGGMEVAALVQGQTLAAVAEPPTYLVLVAGLAGIGAVSRCRRRSFTASPSDRAPLAKR